VRPDERPLAAWRSEAASSGCARTALAARKRALAKANCHRAQERSVAERGKFFAISGDKPLGNSCRSWRRFRSPLTARRSLRALCGARAEFRCETASPTYPSKNRRLKAADRRLTGRGATTLLLQRAPLPSGDRPASYSEHAWALEVLRAEPTTASEASLGEAVEPALSSVPIQYAGGCFADPPGSSSAPDTKSEHGFGGARPQLNRRCAADP
jgi:hypothetical protein